MNYGYFFTMFGLILIGADLIASGNFIASLTDADLYPSPHQPTVVRAKKMDVNNDGLISLDELTRRKNQLYQKLDRKKDRQGDEAELNARLVVMFKRLDRNHDGMLDDIEISRVKHHHSVPHNSRQMHEKRF